MRHVAVAVLMALVGWPIVAGAQEAPQPATHPDVEWYEASYVKFKHEHFYEAERFLFEHWLPVEQAIGRETIIVEHRTGEWDFVIYFPIEGPGDLEQRTSPTWKRWHEAFVEREGEERAAEIMTRLDQMVARSENHLVERWLYRAAEREGESIGREAGDGPARQAIVQVLGDLEQAELGGDVESLVSLFTDDMIVVRSDQPDVVGKDAWRSLMESVFAEETVTAIELRSENTMVLGDWALDWGTYSETVAPAVGEPFEVSDDYVMILRREEGEWKIARLLPYRGIVPEEFLFTLKTAMELTGTARAEDGQ